MAKNPAGTVAAYSDSFTCIRCGKPLEVARPSRIISTTAGLLAGLVVYRLTRNSDNLLSWALPMVYAILSWGFVSALTLMLTADLRVGAEPYRETGAPIGSTHAVHH